MQPTNIGFEDCDAQRVHENLDKETQTSKAVIVVDSKTSVQVSSSIKGTDSDKGSVTLFEFCQILQDPDCPKSVRIIKESVSQEVHKHPKNSLSEEGVANRYKYCKEVIEPYIESYPPDSPLSKENLIKDILASVHQDFPDYQSCIGNYENKVSTDHKESSKVDSFTSFDSRVSKAEMEKGEKKSFTEIEQRPGCFPTDVDTPSGVPDPGCDIKPNKILKSVESEDTVHSTKTLCPPKKTPKECDPTCEAECAGHRIETKNSLTRISEGKCPPPIDYCTRSKAKTQSNESIGNKGKIPSAESFCTTKPVAPDRRESVAMKKENVPVANKSDKKEHSETKPQSSSVSIIKTAMEDFVTKMYSRTNETFTLIRKGNAQDSENLKSPCSEEENEDTKGEESSKGFSFFRKVDSLSNDGESNDSCDNIPPDITIEDFIDNVDSAISNISDAIDFNDLTEPKPQNMREPSDKNQKEPKEIANIIVQTSITPHGASVPQSNSVFTTIKTKICSLFGDEKKKDGDSNISNNNLQLDEDEDADLMERLIE